MKRLLIALSLVLCAAIAAPAIAEHGGKKGKHKGHGLEQIALPDGFQPEGIAKGKRSTFFVGSIPTGDIYRATSAPARARSLVDAPADRAATGSRSTGAGRIFVSGGANDPTKVKGLRVYDSRTGGQVASYPITTAGFINDVVLTKRAAYFTDSLVPVLYKIPIAATATSARSRRSSSAAARLHRGLQRQRHREGPRRPHADPRQEQHRRAVHRRRRRRAPRRRSRSPAATARSTRATACCARAASSTWRRTRTTVVTVVKLAPQPEQRQDRARDRQRRCSRCHDDRPLARPPVRGQRQVRTAPTPRTPTRW